MRFLIAAVLVVTSACTPGSSVTTSPPSTPVGWVEVAPMSVARSEHPGVALEGEVVVAGGFIEIGVGRAGVTDSVEAYDPESDSWRDLALLPAPVHHAMAAVAMDHLFVIGGYSTAGDPVSTVWELVDGEWLDRASLPGPVAAGAAVALGNSIYVVGGTPSGGLFRYDIAEDTWLQLDDPGERREHVAAVAFGGEIWAIAGRWQGEIFGTVEVYDPESGSWRPGPNLNDARSGFGAAVINETIVVAGGELFDPDEALASAERYITEDDEWSLIDSLPQGLHGNPLIALGTDLYLPGGSLRASAIENDGRSYRLDLG